MQLLFLCQQNQGNNVMCHPVKLRNLEIFHRSIKTIDTVFKEDAVCLGHHRSNVQHTFPLSVVEGRIWMPLVVNVKLKGADSDQVREEGTVGFEVTLGSWH